jgi:hypothetical protein
MPSEALRNEQRSVWLSIVGALVMALLKGGRSIPPSNSLHCTPLPDEQHGDVAGRSKMRQGEAMGAK